MKIPAWLLGNRFVKADLSKEEYNPNPGDLRECSRDDANLISSLAWEDKVTGKRFHLPLLDLDVEAELIPSSTPGHSHLYINKLLSEEAYTEVIEVLAKHGLLEHGIVNQMRIRKQTTLRLPHIKKNPPEPKGHIIAGPSPGKSSWTFIEGPIIDLGVYVDPETTGLYNTFTELKTYYAGTWSTDVED